MTLTTWTRSIAAEAVYHSPVEWHPYPGHDLVCLLVQIAAGVFEDFRYERQMAGRDSAMLEFAAHIGGIQMKGAHLIRFNADGEILDIDLIARPAKAVTALGNGIGDKIGPQIKAALAAASRAFYAGNGSTICGSRSPTTKASLWQR